MVTRKEVAEYLAANLVKAPISVYNGPSYLLHAVEALAALNVPLSKSRFLPVIHWALTTEITTYYPKNSLRIKEWQYEGPEQPPIKLGVNIREDRRLRRLLPLTAIGLPYPVVARDWRQQGISSLAGYHQLYRRQPAWDPEWDNTELPAVRLAKQLCAQYRELRDILPPGALNSQEVLHVEQGRPWQVLPNPYGLHYREREREIQEDWHTALELVEVFLTQALLTIAGGDLLGGFDYVVPVEPPGREIDVVINRDARSTEVSKWVRSYPHCKIARDLVFGHGSDEPVVERWSEEDPAIQNATAEISTIYASGRQEPLSPDEMLRVAQKHLPEFVPDYPRQVEMTGGINLGGILLGLIGRWMKTGPFLGLSYSDWAMFTAEEQAILCALLLQRRSEPDQTAIFKTAILILADPEIECWTETYYPEKTAIGTALAQPGRTLALGGIAVLHRPKIVLKIPRDRTRDERADDIEARLAVLKRLFLPVHIEMHCFWKIDRPVLGKSAYLRPDPAWPRDNPHTLGARLVPDAPDPQPVEMREAEVSRTQEESIPPSEKQQESSSARSHRRTQTAIDRKLESRLPQLWEIVVEVDPSLYVHPHPGIVCPAGVLEKVTPITLTETLVGRKSAKRNIFPDISVSDPGISHAHMRITMEPDGSLSVMDLNSINRTYLNGIEMPGEVRTPLRSGDQLTLGCWTRITLRTRRTRT